MFCKSFAPIISPYSKVLILGSMPSRLSLEKQQYYGNPRNHFWPIIYDVLDLPLPLSYEERIKGLSDHGIALWDVLAECYREGSLDASIKNAQVNNFGEFLKSNSALELVCFNGNKAAQLWHRWVQKPAQKLDFVYLPSSSPMVGKNVKTINEKIASWQVIRSYLE